AVLIACENLAAAPALAALARFAFRVLALIVGMSCVRARMAAETPRGRARRYRRRCPGQPTADAPAPVSWSSTSIPFGAARTSKDAAGTSICFKLRTD
ncbi:hypothetical protein, partial [Mesorhizobium sp.]|uniref:hypothetical protein n=1 Tax=Mesorhizobium sp. TaxID=1871066 RepID=UPI0025C2B738